MYLLPVENLIGAGHIPLHISEMLLNTTRNLPVHDVVNDVKERQDKYESANHLPDVSR
jgi:hypothetical protein